MPIKTLLFRINKPSLLNNNNSNNSSSSNNNITPLKIIRINIINKYKTNPKNNKCNYPKF